MTRLYYTLVLLVTSILILATNPCLGFEESIVAAWLFDEGSGKTVKDSMGNFSDSDINGKADWVDGKFGTALGFDDSDGHIQVKFEPEFQMLNESDFTFVLWFQTETTTADRGAWIAGFQEMDGNGTGRTWMGLQNGSEAVYSALGNIRPAG